MTDQELNHLIKMANEIADNLAYGEAVEQIAERVAAHLKRFWAPTMRSRIIDYAADDGESLSPACRLAVSKLSAEMLRD